MEMPVWKHGISYIILAWPSTVDSETQIPDILNSDENVNFTKSFTIDTNVFVLFKLSNSSKFTLWEVYRIRTIIFVRELVNPSDVMSFKEYTNRKPSSRRQNFHEDYTVAVAVVSVIFWVTFSARVIVVAIFLEGQ